MITRSIARSGGVAALPTAPGAAWVRRWASLETAVGSATRGQSQAAEASMDQTFLIGAILGSGLFVFFGREPARRLILAVQSGLNRRR